MTISGNVVSFEIGKKGDSTTDTVILQVVFSDPDDIRPVEWLPGAGVDSVPAIGSRVIVHQIASGYLVSVGGNDGSVPTAAAGETEIYSTADGQAKLARVKCDKDGKVSMGNGTNELLQLFDDLLTELQKTVDLTGVASTGTLFQINPALAIIQGKLGTIKV